MVHLAAVLIPTARKDPLLGARVNVMGTLHVFEAAKRHGVRGIAYASSAAVFGPHDGTHPEPLTHYGAYKLCNEGTARAYWADAGLRSVGLRPSTAYGPGREIGVTADPTLAMRAAAEGRSYTIRFTGPTGMDYAEDVGTIFARAATETPEGAQAFSLQGQLATHGRRAGGDPSRSARGRRARRGPGADVRRRAGRSAAARRLPRLAAHARCATASARRSHSTGPARPRQRCIEVSRSSARR